MNGNHRIELSEKVLTSADRLRCTLIHEMCHGATWIFNNERGHGASWKAWAKKANQIFPELPTISVCHNYDIEYKYTYKCDMCHSKYVILYATSILNLSVLIYDSFIIGPIHIQDQKKWKIFDAVIAMV